MKEIYVHVTEAWMRTLPLMAEDNGRREIATTVKAEDGTLVNIVWTEFEDM
jgi:hypothetical protein